MTSANLTQGLSKISKRRATTLGIVFLVFALIIIVLFIPGTFNYSDKSQNKKINMNA